MLLQYELETVQKRTARFVTGDYTYETGGGGGGGGGMTCILEQLKWGSLKKEERY